MKKTFPIQKLRPEKPEGLPVLKEGSGKGTEIFSMIESLLPWHKTVALTENTWDYWTMKGLCNEIWRPSPVGHRLLLPVSSLVVSVNWVFYFVPYEKHANITTTDTQNGIWWQIASMTGALCSDVVLMMNSIISWAFTWGWTRLWDCFCCFSFLFTISSINIWYKIHKEVWELEQRALQKKVQ